MKKIYTVIGLTIAFLSTNAQVVIQPGAGINATNDVVLVFDNINVVNDDPANNFFTAIVHCKGSGNSKLEGTGNWEMKKLVVDKGGALLSLGADIQLRQQLQMVSGNLDLSGKTVMLVQGARIEGENELSRVIGPTGGALQVAVPMFAPSSQNPGNLGAVLSSNENLGNVIIKRKHNLLSSDQKVQRYFEFIPENNSGLNATLRLNYLDAELNGLVEPSLGIYVRESDAAPWTSIGSSSKNITNNYIEKEGLASLAHVSIGGTVASPLPLRWGAMRVICAGSGTDISWTTLQEDNVKEFWIQASSDGISWSVVGKVRAAGYSSVAKTYTQHQNSGGSMLYRIRSIDFNGSQHFSPVVRFNGCATPLALAVYPVPAKEKATLYITAPIGFSGTVGVVGVDGKEYMQQAIKVTAGSNAIDITLQKLASGIYYVVLHAPDGLLKAKMIKE